MADYSIWVLEYAECNKNPVAGVVYGAHDKGTCRLPYAYALIRGNGVNAMVDVGYNHSEYGATIADEFGVGNWHSAREILAHAGITPEEITHIFITHAHYDHMGGIAAFPNATFYIQERELSKWVWAMSLDQRFKVLQAALDPGDILRAVGLAKSGRLVCVQGDMADVLPGIDLHAAHDTHTWGSQYVHIRNDRRRDSEDGWILAGDLVYRFENLEGWDPAKPSYIPIGFYVGSTTNNVLVLDEMSKRVGGDHRRIVPIHEDRLHQRFPSRQTVDGLRMTEITLADGESSKVA